MRKSKGGKFQFVSHYNINPQKKKIVIPKFTSNFSCHGQSSCNFETCWSRRICISYSSLVTSVGSCKLQVPHAPHHCKRSTDDNMIRQTINIYLKTLYMYFILSYTSHYVTSSWIFFLRFQFCSWNFLLCGLLFDSMSLYSVSDTKTIEWWTGRFRSCRCDAESLGAWLPAFERIVAPFIIKGGAVLDINLWCFNLSWATVSHTKILGSFPSTAVRI